MSGLSVADRSLRAAVRQNDALTVRRAIQNGADVSYVYRQTPSRGFVGTPLIIACENGFDGVVRILLDAGADPWWMSLGGWSAIRVACLQGHVSIVEMLLDHDNGLLEMEDKCRLTPLQIATSIENQTEIVQFLLERGANAHATDASGRTTLMSACQGSSLENMRLMLAAGVDLEARDNSQQTALHHAVFWGFTEGVRELILLHNADMLAVDNSGQTPFDCAELAYEWVRDAIVDCLLQLYGNKVAQSHGRLALHAILRAAKYGYAETDAFHPPLNPLRIILPLGKLGLEHLRTLLHSLDTELIRHRDDDSGKLPIHIACEVNAPVEVLNTLIEMMNPTALQIADHTGSLPLHLLCCSGTSTSPTDYASVRYLVEQGGVRTLTVRDHKCALPLHNLVASSHPTLRTVQYLIQSSPGAATAQTDEGLYPFMVAASETSWASLSVVYELVRANPNVFLPR